MYVGQDITAIVNGKPSADFESIREKFNGIKVCSPDKSDHYQHHHFRRS
jgi:hypothetical protein